MLPPPTLLCKSCRVHWAQEYLHIRFLFASLSDSAAFYTARQREAEILQDGREADHQPEASEGAG